MKIISFLKSKVFIRNFILLIVLLFVLQFLVLKFLKIYTHHSESLTVPDLNGYTIEEVEKICKEKRLRFVVYDSMYIADVPFFTVVEQNPKPFSKVKRNRKIYLTISSDKPPKVKLPNLVDVTLRQAITILQSVGLKVGELEYVPDIAQNVVLRVKKDGRLIKPGTFISKGSYINLVLGDGLSSEKVDVMLLTGLSLDEAIFALSGIGLNIGAAIADASVRDTMNAIVYKQYPEPSDVMVSQGEAIDVWLTSFENFKKMNLKRASLNNSDSLLKK